MRTYCDAVLDVSLSVNPIKVIEKMASIPIVEQAYETSSENAIE